MRRLWARRRPCGEPADGEPAEHRKAEARVDQVDDHSEGGVEPELLQLVGLDVGDADGQFGDRSNDRNGLPSQNGKREEYGPADSTPDQYRVGGQRPGTRGERR